MTARPPWLWVLAGVNGAGKTTLAKAEFSALPFANADERARELAPDDPERAALVAGRLVLGELETSFTKRVSIAWETTLSGRFHHRVIVSAKANGYAIGAIYVGLDSANLALQRIADRVRKGGHNVADPIVRRRYDRSLTNLPTLLQDADIGIVFDNSSPIGHSQVMLCQQGVIVDLAALQPSWLRRAFRDRFIKVGDSVA